MAGETPARRAPDKTFQIFSKKPFLSRIHQWVERNDIRAETKQQPKHVMKKSINTPTNTHGLKVKSTVKAGIGRNP